VSVVPPRVALARRCMLSPWPAEFSPDSILNLRAFRRHPIGGLTVRLSDLIHPRHASFLTANVPRPKPGTPHAGCARAQCDAAGQRGRSVGFWRRGFRVAAGNLSGAGDSLRLLFVSWMVSAPWPSVTKDEPATWWSLFVSSRVGLSSLRESPRVLWPALTALTCSFSSGLGDHPRAGNRGCASPFSDQSPTVALTHRRVQYYLAGFCWPSRAGALRRSGLGPRRGAASCFASSFPSRLSRSFGAVRGYHNA